MQLFGCNKKENQPVLRRCWGEIRNEYPNFSLNAITDKKYLIYKDFINDIVAQGRIKTKQTTQFLEFVIPSTQSPSSLEISAHCGVCMKNFTTITGLRDHIRTKHQTAAGRYQCDPCNRSFNTIEAWLDHVKAKHDK